MIQPYLKVKGVYRPVIGAQTWREQLQVTGSDEATWEHSRSLVLIEAVVEGLRDPFDFCKFGQFDAGHLEDQREMQVGYDEGLLSADGEALIEREVDCVRGNGPLRFAVYLHQYDPSLPLQWEFGRVTTPIQDVPPRLMMLMPYNATD